MEIYELNSYLPLESGAKSEYIQHHIIHFTQCVERGLYSSAFPHLHILYMAFVYFQIYRISKIFPKEFNYGLIGFPGQQKELVKGTNDPLLFWIINEKTVFRFFRLVGLDDSEIGNASAPVSERNDALHAKGDIYCENEVEFEKVYSKYIRLMESIINKQKNILLKIYDNSVEEYRDPDIEIKYDDLSLTLLVPHLFSTKELALVSESKSDRLSQFIINEYGLS